jgi:hypothetical protein
VIPRDQGSELFFRLVSEPSTPKVYLSFAATGLPEEQRKEIEEFKAQVGARFIAFDPLALRERAVITTAQSLAKEIDGVLRPTLSNLVDQPREEDLRWKLMPLDERRALSLTEVRVGDTALDGSQVGAILQAVDSQIISRDYLLIDQSDLVVMYIRMGPDGPLISAGSQSEMIYAYSLGKPVYVVCAGGRAALSPWVTQFSEVFETLPQALEFLTQSYPNAGVQAEEGGG